MTLIAFHGDPKLKAEYLARVMAHQKADEIIHGKYWEDGKGCAVGCTIHSSKHGDYETVLGIPIMLARLEDTLFEWQTNRKAKTFPARFLRAIKPGADLSCVGWQFLHWLLTKELEGRNHPLVKTQIKACADVLVPLMKGGRVNVATNATNAARAYGAAGAAYAAAGAAYAVAADAAAYAAATAHAAAAAAAAAATDAADAAAATDAADAAAYAAAAADAAADAADADAASDAAYAAADAAGRLTCYHRMADKLIALLRAAPMARKPT